MELRHVDFILNHVGRDEDEERIEFGHMDISFYPMYFPDTSSFLFRLGLQYVPGSPSSCSAGCLPEALLLWPLWTCCAPLNAIFYSEGRNLPAGFISSAGTTENVHFL